MRNKIYYILGILILGPLFILLNTTKNSSSTDARVAAHEVPFSRGVNFSGWFTFFSAQNIQFQRFGDQDFIDVKRLGIDVVRLPINIHNMTAGPPDYIIAPLLLKLLDHAVDLAEKHGIYIILDNHPYDSHGIPPTTEHTREILLKIWPQMAEHFKNRGKYVLYEILNEPNGIAASQWGHIQDEAIEAIRRIDQKHTLIVGGTDWNSVDGLLALPKYADQNLIYTFHFYDPPIFTHQGASWLSPSLTPLSGVPFPYDSKRMPRTPDVLRGTSAESALKNYANEAALSVLTRQINRAVAFSRRRNVPVFCGEFGVLMTHSPSEDRVRWYKFICDTLDQRRIPRTSWDYYNEFGIFKTPDSSNFNADLNIDLVRALGFTPPPQRTGPLEPLKSGFTLYDDYFSRGYKAVAYGQESIFDMYDTAAAEGEYAIRWGNLRQYDNFQVDFERNNVDLSYLVQSGYGLEFKARSDKPVRFSVWFQNPEEASSLPWRMRYTVDSTLLPPDGKWHAIRIPLSSMRDGGAWVQATRKWFDPQNKFSWSQVHKLVFSADFDCKDCTIWFDSIKVVR